MVELANALRDAGGLDERESFIDATFASAKGGGDQIGPTKRVKGVKIMAIVDRHGLPLSVSTHAANHHEVTLVQLSFEFYMIEAKPENLIGDRAYDSHPLDEKLHKDGINMIAPTQIDPEETQDPGRSTSAALRASMVGGTILCLASMATSAPDALGILLGEFPRLRSTGSDRYPAKTILR